jgi:hypothetical protein
VDGGIDGFATRRDGATLAVEHTVVEPFEGDITDQTEMLPMFPAIEADKSLLVPGVWITVYVPVGTLHRQGPRARAAIADAIRAWIKENRLSLPRGRYERPCTVREVPGVPSIEIMLSLDVIELPGEGNLTVRRQQIGDTSGAVIEKMLKTKLPKLVRTPATKHVLLLERRHMNHSPKAILKEIENRRSMFPALEQVDQIWLVENTELQQREDMVRFELRTGGETVESFDFQGEKLLYRSSW